MLRMNKWEYTELDLNQVPKRMASIDLLNEAGIQGWELINITVTNRAILKLLVPDTPCKQPPKPRLVSPQCAKHWVERLLLCRGWIGFSTLIRGQASRLRPSHSRRRRRSGHSPLRG